MVRKRSRTARKSYEEENDTDSDFALDDIPSEPAPKKYSLRQRKRRIFTEFEFDDDGEEIEPTVAPSDDEDFEVERELKPDEIPDTQYIDKESYVSQYEPETPEDADGLVDFEDMIRADIVVNKNRIDYDNIIQKTEIKVQPIEKVQPEVVKSKRGRKPKARPAGEIDSSILEPETEMQEAELEDKNDKDYNPDDDLENDEPVHCVQLVHAELSECVNDEPTLQENAVLNDTTNEVNTGVILVDEKETIKEESSNLETNKTAQTDGDLSSIQEEKEDITSKVSPTLSSSKLTVEDDDDVVLVEEEKKSEVIVLDD